MATNVVCPQCGKSDPIEKVSTIYMTGIELNRLAKTTQKRPEGQVAERVMELIPPEELPGLSRRLAPPASSKRAATRPIHPDMIVAALGLISPVFLYGMLTSQGQIMPLAMLVLAAFFVFYFWKRKQLIAKFESQVAASKRAEERIQHGIQRWMRLYYCSDDDCVFEPGNNELVPADQMPGYLLRE